MLYPGNAPKRHNRYLNLKNRRLPHVYHSCTADPKTKGVSILIGRSVPWSMKEVWAEPNGRLLLIKGIISQPCTLATIYSPNASQVNFLEKALGKLQDFSEGVLIWGGGYINLALDPYSTGCTSHIQSCSGSKNAYSTTNV